METIVDLASADLVMSSTIKAIICATPDTPPVASTKSFGSAGVVKHAKPKAKISAAKAETKKLAIYSSTDLNI